MRHVSAAWREATNGAPQKGAQRGSETATRATGEGSPPETPPTTGGEGTESAIAERLEREVGGIRKYNVVK